jgi:phenylacetic acid degradation operon negative regulatory protein
MPVAALIAAGELFGLQPGAIRVALARLLAAGRIARDERGSYHLAEASRPIQQTVGRWRRLDRLARAWDGRWWMVHAPASLERGVRRAHARSLRLHGFRPLRPGLEVRPGNLAGGCASVRESLRALGLAPGALVASLTELDPHTDARARTLWDVNALYAGYRASLERIAASAARLPRLSEAEAMRESFRVGGAVLQQLVLDPQLPDEILDPTDRHALVAAMREYDRLGRSAWAGLLARFGVPHRSAPAGAGFADRIRHLTPRPVAPAPSEPEARS